MLTTALFLSALWFCISFILLILFGHKTKFGGIIASVIWLGVIILAGDAVVYSLTGLSERAWNLSLASFFLGIIWVILLPDWNILARSAWAMMFQTTALYLVYTFTLTAFATTNILGYLLAIMFFFVELFALALSLSYAYEAFDALCRSGWRRQYGKAPEIPGYAPKVSLHIPCYNEPPEVVAKTLQSLALLNYPNFEVLVLDNNTPDSKTYLALYDYCKKLGPRFRFFHLDHWPGYKSGALNFGLAKTSPDAEIIGIIDSDYLVDRNFLSDLVGYFADPRIAFVQTPQDYREKEINSFFKTAYYGYKYFFEISMPSRNEHNAIIFAGTMGLLRKKVLQEIGGWDEWCITEDAEASLRILKLGYTSAYVHKSYGTGLMPLTFEGFKKQRFRWCFGGIQILRKHWESMVPWSGFLDKTNKLTFAQRYYYLVGGLQWYNDLLNLFFTTFLLIGGLLSLFPEIRGFRPFTQPLLIMPALFLLVGLWRFLWVLKNALNLDTKTALRTMINFFSLGWAVTLGSIQGLVQRSGVFLRTPKVRSKLKILRAIGSTQWEIYIGLLCIAAAFFFATHRLHIAVLSIGVMLAWEGALFLSAPAFSLISITSPPAYRPSVEPPGQSVGEQSAASLVFAAVLGLIAAVAVWRLLPQPQAPAPYSRFQPEEIAVPAVLPKTPSPTPTLTPSVTPGPTGEISPTPTAGPETPTPAVSVSPVPSPTVSPGVSPTGVLPSPTPAASGTPVPQPSPTASPLQ